MASVTGRGGFRRSLADALASTWTLLSETTLYLSRCGLLGTYELQLKGWRASITGRDRDKDAIAMIRAEIVQLRKNLRAEGHDLSLGRLNIVFEGFRDDSCVREGFRRLAIVIAGNALRHVSGEDNHIALGGFLEESFSRLGLSGEREYHFLWYRRKGDTIILSGSDTEGKEDFLRFQALYGAKPLLLLAGLRDLR
jgi:hypothetical protein